MKSFLAIDMGYCIATGQEWHGYPVRKSGPVFYIAGEGFAGLSKRLRAWSLANGIDLEGIPFFISNRPTQLLDPNSTQEVINSIDELKNKHGQPVFVVIDTLNRNFGSGDENNTEDMTTFIQNIDTAIRIRYGCSVLIIHHTPLNDPKRARGASALRGALDWEYCLSKHTGDIKKLYATKVKDYEPPPEIHFKPKPILLDGWIDQEDGEIMTSCILEKVESRGDKLNLPKLQGAQKVAYDCLFKLLESNPDGVLVDDWRKKAYEANISSTGTLDAKKKAFQRAVSLLRENGYVQVDNDLWNLCGTRDRDRTFEGHVPEEYGDKRDMCL
jgi:AAA domain